ncbi:MAG: hypothetical protein IPM47_14000 [Sphingobacteriales bacterium]|nr:MAG: hypothetical protein IPM47_14000 [Sphingobacteriales bacterium]
MTCCTPALPQITPAMTCCTSVLYQFTYAMLPCISGLTPQISFFQLIWNGT